ncbi:MAG: methyltransferase dimerization domain-containing protein, partial [Planctomycetota bacterium]
MSHVHPSQTVDDFVQLQHTVAAYHVLRTALRLGVVNELKSGQKTAAQIAATLQLDWAATEMLLLALCQTGLAENYGEDYALSQIGHLLVDPFSLDDEHWSQLEQLVRLGSEGFGTAQPPAKGDV